MTSKKIVLIILLLLAVAFVVGVGTPLLTEPDNGGNGWTEAAAIDEANKLMDGWAGSLAGAFDSLSLSPSFDVQRLQPAASCRKGNKSFQLVADAPCIVNISKKQAGSWDWFNFEKMVLSADSDGLSLQVCHCEKDDGAASRGASFRVKTKKVLKVPGRLKLSDRPKTPAHPGGVVVQERPRLEVSYFPKGKAVVSGCESGEIHVCEVVEQASLVVLDDGGTVRLACEGCSASNPAVVTIE